MICLLCCQAAGRAVGVGMELYVAVQGHDDGDGSAERPFASLAGARDAIRRLKRAGGLPPGGVTVQVRGGTYRLADGFTLSAEDSGTPEAPIVYRACAGETVRLWGGRTVTGFTPVTDEAVLARLDPAARGQVRQLDVRAQGVGALGGFHSRGFARPVTPAHLELYCNGERQQVARWPNDGFATIAGYPADAGEGDGHGQQMGKLEAGFLYSGDRPQHWQQTGDIWLHGYWSWDWANSYEQVAAIDTTRRLITTKAPYGHYGFRTGQRFYALNILEELNQPGEYYLDRACGILYWWPPTPLEGAEVVVTELEAPLIALKDAAHVTLRGFTLEYSRGSGITVQSGAGVTIGGCTLRHLGNWGVLVNGGKGHTVTGCDIADVGDGGLRLIGGDRATLTPAGHAAVNNHIHHIGVWSRCYQPGVEVGGVGNRVAHNDIHDGPHNAIQLGGNEHIVEFNDIHRVCLETGDVGAFYMGRDWTQRGNIVRYNYFHEIGGVGMGSFAVYPDDCSSGVTVFGNIFYHVQTAMFCCGGRDNRYENNVIVDCAQAFRADGRGLDASPTWHGMVYDTMKGRLEAMQYQQPPYRDRYPALLQLEKYYAADKGVPPEGNVVRRNIVVNSPWLEIGWHADPALFDIRDNLVGQDAHFVDAAHEQFQLRDDSPAFVLGFQRIPVERIGLYIDEYRPAPVEVAP